MIGLRIGNYTIKKALGKGGMAVVYVAQHSTLPTRAAVKVLTHDLSRDPAYVERFIEEAKLAASLDDPNVVRVFDGGVLEDGRPYLLMELVEGTTLHEMTKDTALPLARAVRILSQLASGIAAVHRLGFIHRDIKPENVALHRTSTSEHVKLLDFGLARPERSGQRITAAGVVMGTPEFISPEQAMGLPAESRSDLYSFGCVAFTVLAGRAPFEGFDGPRVLIEHMHAPVPCVRDHRPDVPDRLADLVTSCLAKSPCDRPASMEIVLAELAAIEGELTLPLHKSTVPPPIESSMTGQIFDAPKTTVTLPSSRRTPVALALATLAAVVLVGVAMWLVPRRTQSALEGPQPSSVVGNANPFKPDDIFAINAGSALWRSHCVRCHGILGDGAGTDVSKDSKPKSFVDLVAPPGALDAYYFGVIRHGVEHNGTVAMPSFAKQLGVRETWQVVAYLGTLQPKPVKVDVDAEIAYGPPPETFMTRAHGRELYLARCSTCHGERGQGDGAAAPMIPDPPTNLAAGAWDPLRTKSGDDDLRHVFRTIAIGYGDYMGAYSGLPVADRWAIARFVLTLRTRDAAQSQR